MFAFGLQEQHAVVLPPIFYQVDSLFKLPVHKRKTKKYSASRLAPDGK